MTIINNIEIDHIHVNVDETKLAIQNNEPIDNVLHVVCVVSNPCMYATRYILARKFIKRMEVEDNIKLYVCELIYEDQNQTEFYVTDKKNPNHLQLRTKTPLWHKENMINVLIRKKLPSNWKAVAWIDMDLIFESSHWAMDTLKLLNGKYDIVQLFSHIVDMNKSENTMNIFHSFGYKFANKRDYVKSGNDFWHPGYAWACSRKAYEKMGGLYQMSILGSGDHNISFSIIGNCEKSVNEVVNPNYLNSLKEFENKAKHLRLGYVPGVIKHEFHGTKKNRKYGERWKILIDHNYDPIEHLITDKNGILQPSKTCPPLLISDILHYFSERNEDEFAT
jgi:hypothetical protein